MGVKYIATIMGESTDPCGTPCFIRYCSDYIKLFILIDKHLLNKSS